MQESFINPGLCKIYMELLKVSLAMDWYQGTIENCPLIYAFTSPIDNIHWFGNYVIGSLWHKVVLSQIQ